MHLESQFFKNLLLLCVCVCITVHVCLKVRGKLVGAGPLILPLRFGN